MKFTHLACKKLGVFVEPKAWPENYKPPKDAFYVACNNSWEDWLREEELDDMLGRYHYRYTYDIPKHKLLPVDSPAAIAAFQCKYAKDAPIYLLPLHIYEVVYGPYKPTSLDKRLAPRGYAVVRNKQIDWGAVLKDNKQQYIGVLVDPAQNKPYETWIDMFDVCSAVLWSMDGVKLKKTEKVSFVRKNPNVPQKKKK
jgi:hypothetical protein